MDATAPGSEELYRLEYGEAAVRYWLWFGFPHVPWEPALWDADACAYRLDRDGTLYAPTHASGIERVRK
jgi:hypothetical protein